MSYLDIPLANQTLATSQGQIRTNFSLIKTDIGRDHVPMDAATVNDRGKHKFVEYLVQAADPTPAGPLATDSYLFTKAVGGVTQMFWQRVGGSAVQMTQSDPVINVGPPFQGKTFLPGGILLQFGYINVNPSTATTVTFPQAFSAIPYTINLTLQKSATGSAQPANVVETTITNTTFQIWHTATGAHLVYWTAIGPQ